MSRTLSRSLLIAVVSMHGCAPAPRPEPAPRSSPAPATASAPPFTPQLASANRAAPDAPSSAPASTPPPPPPRALAGTDAFYIMSFPLTGPAVGPSATVCGDDSACRAVTPDDKGEIRRAFDEESWVVIRAPARYVASVATDGKVAAVTFQPQCPSGTKLAGAQTVLYRVAKSVTATSVTVVPRSGPCPKAP